MSSALIASTTPAELRLTSIDFATDERIPLTSITSTSLLGCASWANALLAEIADAKTAATEHASLVFLYMMVCVLKVSFNALYGVHPKKRFLTAFRC